MGRNMTWLTEPAISSQNPSTKTHPESTRVAAMIYYKKTLFGNEPKLTAIHLGIDKSFNTKLNSPERNEINLCFFIAHQI